MNRVTKEILLVVGWLAGMVGYWYVLVMVALSHNLFDWDGEFGWMDLEMAGYLAGLIVAFVVISGWGRIMAGKIVTLLAALALFVLGILSAYDERTAELHQGFFARTELPPWWFSITMVILSSLPLLFVLLRWKPAFRKPHE